MTFRSGFVALVGRPNSGKSTLLNALLGEKVAIVSPRPQTTRTRIHGILHRDDAQIVFVDTPGMCKPGSAIRKAMRRVAGHAAADADLTLLLTEPSRGDPEIALEDRQLVDSARQNGRRVFVGINKVDLVQNKGELLPWIQMYSDELDVEAVIPISAKLHDGLDLLVDELLERLPEGPELFPKDMHTDQAERFICAELVREQLLLQLREEVPHSAAVVIEDFEDGRNDGADGLVRIEGRVIVERDSQKGIVIGKRGQQIKDISAAARQQIESLLGAKVFLRMQVSVDPKWTRDARSVQRYGIGPDGGEGG